MLKIEKILTPYNFTEGSPRRRKDYIVVHYFGCLGTAKATAQYFASQYRGASAHFCLDEKPIVYQCVDVDDTAWHCGTKGKYYHPECRNSNSIGVEVRPGKIDPSTARDAGCTDWYFSKQVEDNLVEFVRSLMEQYHIGVDHVVRHYDVTHKLCPRPWVGDDLNTYYQTTGNAQWKRFKQRLLIDESEKHSSPASIDIAALTDEQCVALWNRITMHLRDNDKSSFSDEACQWAIDAKIISGTGGTPPNYQWQAPLTREQFVTMLHRYNAYLQQT